MSEKIKPGRRYPPGMTEDEWYRVLWESKYEHIPSHYRPKNRCIHCGRWPISDGAMVHHVCETVASHLQVDDWDAFNSAPALSREDSDD